MEIKRIEYPGIIEFYKERKNKVIAMQMGRLNNRFCLNLLDNEELEKMGNYGNYFGRLDELGLDISYTKKQDEYMTSLNEEKFEVYHVTSIWGINFENQEYVKKLVKHPYVRSVAKLFGKIKALDGLLDRSFIDGVRRIEEKSITSSSEIVLK
jgi:hypothetical protein|tara:strand:+ start:613 stop:1071 length:459 start_codon:yes stop_codon:yes gene_type:complete